MRTCRAAVMAALALASGCATAISGSASSVAHLEQEHAAHPTSERVQRSLGIAYFKANRLTDARTALEQAVGADSTDGVAALYLGMTAEGQHDVPAARAAYQRYLRVGRTPAVRKQIAARLSTLNRAEADAALKQALAREAELSATPGSPQTIAVLPFKFSGSDSSLKPLERGFAELLTTDLSRASALTVLDRSRIQMLLDELALQRSGATAEGSGVRAGRILQAGRLVGGSISQLGRDQLRADATITDVPSARTIGTTNDQETLKQLFTMEKDIALGLITDMHITLTTAERNAIEQRPTRSLAAFLAYSRGLELEDEGRFDAAGRLFDNATRLDPNFGAAHQKSVESHSLSAGSQVTTSSVESALRGTPEGASVVSGGAPASVTGSALAMADGINPSPIAAATSGATHGATQPLKDPSSGTGGDNVAGKVQVVTIPIHNP